MSDQCMSNWTLFSNHGHVLVCLARDSESRLRDVAVDVGITERAVQKIVRDLQDSGMVSVTKHGRRNRYQINNRQSLRHDLEANCTLGGLIDFINKSKPDRGVIEKAGSAEPDPVTNEQIKPPPVKPEPAKDTLAPPVTKEPGFVKVKPEKPEKPEPENFIEKQQGSLF